MAALDECDNDDYKSYNIRKSENIVSGLTTASGLWVVAAIGLACGGGMYLLATASTILVLAGFEAFNYLLHKFDSHWKGNKE